MFLTEYICNTYILYTVILFRNIKNYTYIKGRAGHQCLEIHPATSEIYIRNVYATYFMGQNPLEELIVAQVPQSSQILMESEDSLQYSQSPSRVHNLNRTDQVNTIHFQFPFNIVLIYLLYTYCCLMYTCFVLRILIVVLCILIVVLCILIVVSCILIVVLCITYCCLMYTYCCLMYTYCCLMYTYCCLMYYLLLSYV